MEFSGGISSDMVTPTEYQRTGRNSRAMAISPLTGTALKFAVHQEVGPWDEESATREMVFYNDPMLQAMGLQIQEELESYMDSDDGSDDYNAPLLRPSACPTQHTADADMECLLREMYMLCVSQSREEEEEEEEYQPFSSVYDLARHLEPEDQQSDSGESEISSCSTSASYLEKTQANESSDDDQLWSASESCDEEQ